MGASFIFRTVIISTLCIVFVANFRLPTDIVPESYELEIITNLGDEDDTFSFSGRVQILIKCVSATSTITLHAKDLQVDTTDTVVTPIDDKANPIKVKTSEKLEIEEHLVLTLDGTLKADASYELELKFEAPLKDELRGFYKTYYEPLFINKTWVALTHFKPYYARRAFPCFDEPQFKTDFNISIGRSEKYKSLSNTALAKTEKMEDKPGWEWDRYEVTPPMATHVLGFMVSELVSQEMASGEGGLSSGIESAIKYKLWTTKLGASSTDYVRGLIPQFTDFFENYFDFPYPLPKQDMIILPELPKRSMSSWGLIFLTQRFALFWEKKTPLMLKESIANMVAHELAHQWFGNLVTIKWWSDIWLSEGFSNFMAAEAINKIHPAWNTLNIELTNDIISVIAIDSLNTSHPLSVAIEEPSEIEEYFDIIELKKGSFLLRMMSHFLDPNYFHESLLQYMVDNIYLSMDKDQLMSHLTKGAHRTRSLAPSLSVATIMDNWLTKPGIPLITVTRNYRQATAELKQERFFKDRDLLGTDDTKWWIPLTYTTECELYFNNTKVRTWLKPEDASLTIEIVGLVDWVIFNVQAAGLYLVDYDSDNWRYIRNYLLAPTYVNIPIINRVLLIESAFNLAWVGRMDYLNFFSMMDYLEQESEYLPWKAAIHCFNELDVLVRRTSVYPRFMAYMRGVIAVAYEKAATLYPDPEATSESIHHAVQITSTGCKYQMESCRAAVRFIMDNHKDLLHDNEKAEWSNDLHEVVICNARRNKSEKDWSELWERRNESIDAHDPLKEVLLLRSAACCNEESVLKKYLGYTLDEDQLRPQDVEVVINAVLSNNRGFSAVQEFLDKNFEAVITRIISIAKAISSIVIGLARCVINDEEYKWLEEFFKKYDANLKVINKSVLNALEIAKVNVQWHKENYQAVEQFMIGSLKGKTEEDDKDLISESRKMKAKVLKRQKLKESNNQQET